jgi:dTDP-4-dehydrorhamnose 3,5-epimerase
MKITDLGLGVLLIEPKRLQDERGFFSETYRASALAEAGVDEVFVQDNHSLSAAPFTVRGLHFQLRPHAQAKLVRATRGAIFDVAVDLRPGSSSFGRSVAAELTADNGRQLLVPRGFAHGFQTLGADTEVQYKVSAYYDREAERGLRWNDPVLAIDWPEKDPTRVLTNGRDEAWPDFAAWSAGAEAALV